jgi:hypothetical protein
MSPPRYIRASEINTYLFCKRAWHLGQRGEVSSLGPQRAQGAAYHQQHGDQVRSASSARMTANWFAVAGAFFLAIFLWLVLR